MGTAATEMVGGSIEATETLIFEPGTVYDSIVTAVEEKGLWEASKALNPAINARERFARAEQLAFEGKHQEAANERARVLLPAALAMGGMTPTAVLAGPSEMALVGGTASVGAATPALAVSATVGGPASGIAGLVFSMSTGGGGGSAGGRGGTGGGSLGQQIAQGHAFQKHVVTKGEYKGLGISTRSQFAQHIDDIANNASGKNVRSLSGGRTAYWDDASGTVVIHNPAAVDAGTAFRPTTGRKYFEGLK